jgi:hypothetical protein
MPPGHPRLFWVDRDCCRHRTSAELFEPTNRLPLNTVNIRISPDPRYPGRAMDHANGSLRGQRAMNGKAMNGKAMNGKAITGKTMNGNALGARTRAPRVQQKSSIAARSFSIISRYFHSELPTILLLRFVLRSDYAYGMLLSQYSSGVLRRSTPATRRHRESAKPTSKSKTQYRHT